MFSTSHSTEGESNIRPLSQKEHLRGRTISNLPNPQATGKFQISEKQWCYFTRFQKTSNTQKSKTGSEISGMLKTANMLRLAWKSRCQCVFIKNTVRGLLKLSMHVEVECFIKIDYAESFMIFPCRLFGLDKTSRWSWLRSTCRTLRMKLDDALFVDHSVFDSPHLKPLTFYVQHCRHLILYKTPFLTPVASSLISKLLFSIKQFLKTWTNSQNNSSTRFATWSILGSSKVGLLL